MYPSVNSPYYRTYGQQQQKYPQYQHPMYQNPSGGQSNFILPDESVRSEPQSYRAGIPSAIPLPTTYVNASPTSVDYRAAGSPREIRYTIPRQSEVVQLRSRRSEDDRHKQIAVLEEHLSKERRERKTQVGELESQKGRVVQELVVTTKNLEYVKQENDDLKELIHTYCSEIKDSKDKNQFISDRVEHIRNQHRSEIENVKRENAKLIQEKGDDMLQYCNKIKVQHAELESECQALRAQVARLKDELARQRELTDVYAERNSDFNQGNSTPDLMANRVNSLGLEEELKASKKQIENLTALNERNSSELQRVKNHMQTLHPANYDTRLCRGVSRDSNTPLRNARKLRNRAWEALAGIPNTSSIDDEVETLAEKDHDGHGTGNAEEEESGWFEPLLPRA